MSYFLESLTETRFMNMIRFSLHFNRLMGSKVEDMDATYILEKWHSYFGNSKPPAITTDFVDSFIKTKWCSRWSNFDLVVGHIQLIQSLQKKMTPLLIIEMFDGIEWDDTHRDVPYNGTYITSGSKTKNFALDDFEVLETEFKDVIRDNKLKKILHDV